MYNAQMTTSGTRTYETVFVECVRPGVVLATLDRPDRLNALTSDTFAELIDLCAQVDADPTVRVVILTGRGRGFCSGLDLELADALPRMAADELLEHQEGWAGAIVALRRMTKPVIAAVNGVAAGAGLALALAADVRIAVPTARFNAAFVRIGLTGGDVGVSWLLPRVVGLGHAAEILLTGRLIDAEHALRIGLVNSVVAPDGLMAAAHDLADEIAANSPFGIRLTKQVLQQNVDAPSLEAAVELENRNQVLATRSADMVEALQAFRDKRPPRFGG